MTSTNDYFIDKRIGGLSRLALQTTKRSPMQMPEEFLDCCVFLGPWSGETLTPVPIGTAFWVYKPSPNYPIGFQYLVTAGHLVEGMKAKGARECAIRLNLNEGGCEWVPIPINKWVVDHDKTSDLAICLPSLPFGRYAHKSIPSVSLITNKQIQEYGVNIGDILYMTGLFNKSFGINRNTPMLRSGMIAGLPDGTIPSRWHDSSIRNIKGTIIELKSIGGHSGSPVYINLGLPRYDTSGKLNFYVDGYRIYLFGLLQGHWDENLPGDTRNNMEPLNLGMGIVISADTILKFINSPESQKLEYEIERKYLDSVAASTD